jgi:hypothetical protein
LAPRALCCLIDPASDIPVPYVGAEARVSGLADDLAKARARIKELEARPEASTEDNK